MIKKLFFTTLITFTGIQLFAQQFLSEGMIEFEVKTNLKKTMSYMPFEDMLKDKLPQFKTAYYNYTFSNNESAYQFSRWNEQEKIPDFLKKDDEENKYYFNFNENKFSANKLIFGSSLIINDTLPAIQWKFANENKIIAGFNCKKAVGKIFDSVYIFAFYTDEILIPGGPASINGLPGMILGLTIPRLYTSWMATKVVVTDFNKSVIKPFTAKKTYTTSSLISVIQDKSKDFMWDNDINAKRRFVDYLTWSSTL